MSRAFRSVGTQTSLILAALACLLLSDGVGPRLLPYPSRTAAAPVAAHGTGAPQASLSRSLNLQRERALITSGIKLSQAKPAGDDSRSAAEGFAAPSRQTASRISFTNVGAFEDRTSRPHSSDATPAHLRGPPSPTNCETI